MNVSTPPPLHEAFAHPAECHVMVTSLFIDIANSTAMQQNEPEASWVPQLGWFYKTVHELLDKLRKAIDGDVDVKYLGDGIMVTVGSRFATELVNFGIETQETVCRAARRPADGGKGTIDFHVSVGVVTGKAYRFTSPDGLVDYVSKTVSTSRRLCDAATPRAVFIDDDTQMTCNLSEVHSQIGTVQDRSIAEYLGDRSEVALKGLNGTLGFHEVLWEMARFGVKGEVASATTIGRMAPEPAPRAASVSTPRPTEKPQRASGVVKSWNPERNFGFITSGAGEEFYFNRQLLAYPSEDADDIKVGDRVAFMTLPAAKEGACRQAGVVLFDEEEADGTVQSLPSERTNHWWILVEDARKTRHFVYAPADALSIGAVFGDKVEFRVRVGPQGASASEIRLMSPRAVPDVG